MGAMRHITPPRPSLSPCHPSKPGVRLSPHTCSCTPETDCFRWATIVVRCHVLQDLGERNTSFSTSTASNVHLLAAHSVTRTIRNCAAPWLLLDSGTSALTTSSSPLEPRAPHNVRAILHNYLEHVPNVASEMTPLYLPHTTRHARHHEGN